MKLRQKAPNVPTLRDTPGPPRVGTSIRRRPYILSRQNPSKTSPKSVRFRACEFINVCTSTTYNGNSLKWTDFLVGHSGNRQSKIPNLKSNNPDNSERFQNTPFTTNATTATYKTGPIHSSGCDYCTDPNKTEYKCLGPHHKPCQPTSDFSRSC